MEQEKKDPTEIEDERPRGMVFEGVSADLLRATAPVDGSLRQDRRDSSTPMQRMRAEARQDAAEERMNGAASKGESGTGKNGQRLTGSDYDPYGLRAGKESCLRSVVDRIRGGRMNPVEEARAMSFLLENGIVESQAELSVAMSRPKSKISEKLSILKLPKSVTLLMERHGDVLTEGHAVELLRLKDEALISSVASRIIEQGLTRDRLRTEIAFMLQKHGSERTTAARPRKPGQARTYLRYFPRVDGGFDVIYRFRPEATDQAPQSAEEAQALATMIADMESKLEYLKKIAGKRGSTSKPHGS